MKKTLIITLVILVLLVGMLLSIALYDNSPFNKAKNNNVYKEDENNNAVPKESDNIDCVPSRVETSGDSIKPANDGSYNISDDNGREENDTSDNESYKGHNSDSKIKLRADTKDIRVSSGTETVCFRAETSIDSDRVLLIDAITLLPVAIMVDDGQCSISGDELMNDNVYSCKVDIDISQENLHEYYAVIRNDENKYDSIGSNTVKIKVYAGFTEKELFGREEVFTAIDNLENSDEYKSMDLDSKTEAMYELLVDLSENGTPDTPYSLIQRESIHFSKEKYMYSFTFQSGGVAVIPLIEHEH